MIGHFKLKNGFILLFLSCIWSTAQAQSGTRYAFVNMEYIFSCIPDYAKAQQELDDYSQKLQADIDAVYAEIAEMQSRYNADKVFLTCHHVLPDHRTRNAQQRDESHCARYTFHAGDTDLRHE